MEIRKEGRTGDRMAGVKEGRKGKEGGKFERRNVKGKEAKIYIRTGNFQEY